MIKKFQRTIEDFICKKCGTSIKGTGYTNHCPNCLWSKHVDVNPGDRAEICGGMMSPVKVEIKGGIYTLTHKCEKCGFERRKKMEDTDNFEAAIDIAKKVIN